MRSKQRVTLVFVLWISACAGDDLASNEPGPRPEPVQIDPNEAPALPPGGTPTTPQPRPPLPEVTCAGNPSLPSGSWRHGFGSRLVIATGDANHRGLDLVATASAAAQIIRGEVKYGLIDKDLEDETIEVFACRAGLWEKLGAALTDDDGDFSLTLSGPARLPLGVRDMYLSVLGDRSGAHFSALVARDGDKLVVSDVDGTLTSSENAYPISLLTDDDVAVNEGAPAALHALVRKGYHPIYVSSRGRIFTASTRAWLAAKGLPRGTIRLAAAPVTLPGEGTAEYKRETLTDLAASGLAPSVGFGNRASDAAAYQSFMAPTAIFLRQPEFADENSPVIDAGAAIGFESYLSLGAILHALPDA